jgi:hypothetical protein
MTAAEVITLSRDWLKDTIATYRWSDATLLGYLNDTIRDVFRRRPDLRLATDGTLNAAFTNMTATSDTAPLGYDFKEILAHGVTYRGYQRDSADTENANLASLHFQQYVEGL